MQLTPLKSRLFAVAQNSGIHWTMASSPPDVAARIKEKDPRILAMFLKKFNYTMSDILAESNEAKAAAAKSDLGDGSDLPDVDTTTSEKCIIVTLENGNKYVSLPESKRMFSYYQLVDGNWAWRGGQRGRGPSMESMSRHFYSPIKSEEKGKAIPDEIKQLAVYKDNA